MQHKQNPSFIPGRLDAHIVLDMSRIEIDVQRRDAPEHPGGRKLLDFWMAHKTDGGILTRRDVPSREIATLMPHMFILEPADEAGTDWRFRLFGERLASRFGGDPTGMCISQIYAPHQIAHQADLYRTHCREGTPMITSGRFLGIDRDYVDFEITHVPLETADAMRRQVLGGIFFGDTVHSFDARRGTL